MTTPNLIRRLLIPRPAPIPAAEDPGLYHFMREADGTYTRFHLRIDPDGSGMLLANATTAASLSPAGVVIAKGLLKDHSEASIIERLRQEFKGASEEQMRHDLELVAALIANLAAPGDNYPIINLDDAAISPFEASLMSPLHADVRLGHGDQIRQIVTKLWDAAIPHVTFRLDERWDPEVLVGAVERAEDLGMIAAVRGRASQLDDRTLLGKLYNAGLDHLDFLFLSADPTTHDVYCGNGDHSHIKPLVTWLHDNEVTPVAEMAMLEMSLHHFGDALDFLLRQDIYNCFFFAIGAPDEMLPADRDGALTASSLPQWAEVVEDTSNTLFVRFIWQPTVMRDPSVPVSAQVRQGPRTADDLSILVEEDGTVVPPRGLYRSAGNLLNDHWQDIWANEAFVSFRERVEKPTRCDECPDLAICAVDCPRKIKGWSQAR